MADWPKAISPENRIEYLIDARREVKDGTTWTVKGDQSYEAKFRDWHFYITLSAGAYEALIIETDYLTDNEHILTPYPMGSYRTMEEARQMIVDEIVVKVAVQQAWEDVAG